MYREYQKTGSKFVRSLILGAALLATTVMLGSVLLLVDHYSAEFQMASTQPTAVAQR
ncbi:MAG TPA: hypothetical protein VF229_04150 [Burkholderiaceae bacterium]